MEAEKVESDEESPREKNDCVQSDASEMPALLERMRMRREALQKSRKMFKIILLSVLLCVAAGEAYKILVVFPLPGKSHSFLGAGVARHLVEAGHEVTLATPFPDPKNNNPLLREIHITALDNFQRFVQVMMNLEDIMNRKVGLRIMITMITMFLDAHTVLFEDENFKKLLNDPKEQFDVVIGEWMMDELLIGIAPIFKAPFIWVSTVDPHWKVLQLIDEIPNPAYNADLSSSGYPPFTFFQRAQELFKIGISHVLQYFFINEHEAYQKVIVPFIEKRGHRVPDFEELRYNASLMLGNSHVSMGSAVRLPQNYKPVGGYHIDTDVKPLPADLQKLLDNSKNGLIYFSMGSNLPSKLMPEALKTSLVKMFGKLKQNVLWKFEEDLPNRSKNLHIVQWAPQQSILAHPNCILFITHGGLLSTTETIHFGKPIIGIPVFADQFANVDKAVSKGFAKRVDLKMEMADDLLKGINDILTDPSYTAKVKELSMIYHDRPVPPGKELVHWVEHVVRTGGALHLRSPALLVPWYQKFYLDLVFVIVISVYCLYLLLKKLGRIIISKIQLKKKKTQ